jgi:replicative DNA helicase
MNELPENEAAVIGAMILDPSRIDEAAQVVKASDFADQRLRQIFVVLLDMHQAGSPIDVIPLVANLKAAGLYESIGGAAVLAKLSAAVPNASDIAHYANEVHSAAIIRALKSIARIVINKPDQDAGGLLDFVDTEVARLRDQTITTAVPENIGEIASRECDAIDEASEAGEVRGLRTGLECFDRVNGGYQAGTLNIIAARPSNGKSVLGLQFAKSIGTGFEYELFEGASGWINQQPPIPTLFLSLEMTKAELSARALASETEIDGRRINSYRVTASQRADLRRSAEAMKDFRTSILQPHRATVSSIRATARIEQRKNGLGCLVIDYLQLIDIDGRFDKETYRIGEICRRLKSLAMELSIPVIVLCQLNRDAENKLPTLAQLADSGKIEQHADTITAIHRSRGDSNDAQLVLMKWRNGQTPTIDLTFERQYCRFAETPIENHSNYNSDFAEYGGADQ